MDISWDAVVKALPALLTALVTVIASGRGPGALRARLRHDVEVLEKLPPNSEAHSLMLDLVSQQVARVKQLDTEASRNIPLMIGAIVGAVVLGYASVWLLTLDSWWTTALAGVAAFFALTFGYGIFDSAQKVPRDEKGDRK